ncbi:MAG: histidine kinase [Crocinitomicaceae bacterium]|nr:histidine kinase [Crocinitomicaceae bacterium]
MHTKRFYWLAQLIGWFSYTGLIVFSVYNRNPADVDSIFLLNVLILVTSGIVVTHLQRIFFIQMGWLGMRLPRLIPRLLISSILSSILIATIDNGTDYLTGLNHLSSSPITISQMVVNVLATLLLVLFWNALYFTFHFFQKSRKQEISNLELAASNKESELKNLRSQLNPHFLFNSLNSIRALIDIDPKKAKVSITTLSNLLRQSLILGRENLVTLESEIGLAQSYLELEKIRFEERLQVEWDLTPGLENFQIPPFSLQMMVENAIKHGISNLRDGGSVKISALETEKEIIVIVENSGSLMGIFDLGVGIENIKQRLALQYGNGAEFSLKEKGGTVIAQMNFRKNETV